ncbi:hypothetical protein GMDG_01950 [Pseudogymnoascus destructans 20631-21]|uniref:Uncharacterized protein n=1 Tax=Pseudogymnoascus destructans (strain ATCC MYA-4855 / 20631-21) TaxID=658429 RepID=L8FZP5_PSED2|nr:hypothetical protein GMDG_01950 [Pseudogymnoascus destructans 20631-21]
MSCFTRSAMLRFQSLRAPLSRIGLSSLHPTPLRTIPRLPLARTFTSTIRLAAKKAFPKPLPQKQSPQNPPAAPPTQTYQSYTAKLASRSAQHPSTSPPPTPSTSSPPTPAPPSASPMRASATTLTSTAPPSGLSAWVPIAFAGICFLMAGMGGWLLFAPTSLIRSITAYPVKSLVANGQPTLRIDIELRRVLPIPLPRPPRRLRVPRRPAAESQHLRPPNAPRDSFGAF